MATRARGRWLAVAVALLWGCHRPAAAEGALLWSLPDPAGDDHGDGQLRYPGRGGPEPGELDLLELRALPAAGGTLFEATFARPVARTDGRAFDETGATLEQVARLGFHAFNLDIHVDLDRIPGSGSTRTLPGRKAEVDPAFAWERTICLTPRPAEARDLLRQLWRRSAEQEAAGRGEVLDEAGEAALRARVEEELGRVWFPTRVRVLGRRISFFVPEELLGGRAEARFGYTVLVTAADLHLRLDLGALLGRKGGPESLFAMPLAPGHPLDRLGGGHLNDPQQPPVVDLLAPAGASQEELLRRPPYRLPGVVPAQASPQPPDPAPAAR